MCHGSVTAAATARFGGPSSSWRTLDHVPDDPHDDELDTELERLAAQPLRIVALDPETGERVTGTLYRDHLAQAQIERDEQR